MVGGLEQTSGLTVSHETIYLAIYALPRRKLRRELVVCLRQGKPHQGRRPKASALKEMEPGHLLPAGLEPSKVFAGILWAACC